MNIYLLIYIILIIILIFIIINFYLLKSNSKTNKKNIFENYQDINDIKIDTSVFEAANSNSFPDDEDPGDALLDLKIPDMQQLFEETQNNQGNSNIKRPPILLGLTSASSTSSVYKSSSNDQLYPAELIQQKIQEIDNSNLLNNIGNSIYNIVNNILPVEEEYNSNQNIIEEECCIKSPPKLHALVCGDHYDICRVDEEGNDSCCDGYTCLRPNGNFGEKKCLNSSDTGFNLRVPDVDTTGYYDLTIPKTDFDKLRIPGFDMSDFDISKINIPGFNISDIGKGLSKLNPLNINTCNTGKYTYNKWTGEVTENPSSASSASSVSSASNSFYIPSLS